jgi:hypothetical protein
MNNLKVYKTDIHTWTYTVARVKSHQIYASADTEGRMRYTSNEFEISAREDGCPPGLFAHCTGDWVSLGASRSHSNTTNPLGLLCTNDQPEAETSVWQHTIITTDNTTIPPAGYEHTIPTNERPQKHVLDGAATGIGRLEGNIKLNLQKEEKMDLIVLEQFPMAGSCLRGNTGTSPDICNLPIRC